jgi:hypothetical protein
MSLPNKTNLRLLDHAKKQNDGSTETQVYTIKPSVGHSLKRLSLSDFFRRTKALSPFDFLTNK